VDFPKVLRPGKAGVIKVKVETGNNAGPKSKTITIKSNDPLEPSKVVHIALLVKP
jgi:hypothetical protein